MAEKTVFVCDDCGKAAVESVQVMTSKGKVELDVCSAHLSSILARGRRVRRGRPRNGALKPTRGTAKRAPKEEPAA
jgi:hypothetical protein